MLFVGQISTELLTEKLKSIESAFRFSLIITNHSYHHYSSFKYRMEENYLAIVMYWQQKNIKKTEKQ